MKVRQLSHLQPSDVRFGLQQLLCERFYVHSQFLVTHLPFDAFLQLAGSDSTGIENSWGLG